ncbi:DNA replication protein [Testudinibacter sp. P80/BLE/0925]
MRASQVLKLIGRPVAYYKDLARPLGGATAAILFSQLFYWSDKTDNPLGVYKQLEELCDETGLTLEELRSARKKLVSLGVLNETYKRLEHRLYFKLDLAVFDELMIEFGEQGKTDLPTCENPSSRNGESRFGEQGKTDFVIDQETTTLDYNNNPLPPKASDDTFEESATAEALPAGEKKKSIRVDYQAVVDAYNEENDKSGQVLPACVALNDKRRKAIKRFMVEIKEPTLDCARAYFQYFFADLKPFHTGENDRDWKANFDYALRSDTVIRVREGGL